MGGWRLFSCPRGPSGRDALTSHAVFLCQRREPMKRTITQLLVVAAAAVVITSLSVAFAAPAKCPAIYAPVICDNGKVYPNQCYADQHHAKNCVPYGI